MRLGGAVFCDKGDPEIWARAHVAAGFSAAYLPDVPDEALDAYAKAAAAHDAVIAEVGAWSNPLDDDPDKRKAAFDKCVRGLHRAERVGALCCVNIAGSRGSVWDGPHPDNLSRETFDMIVECVRRIIDEAKPTRTTYALETMPWIWPDGPAEYLELIRAIDRKAFAVHLDPVNMINSPRRVFENAAFLRECFDTLGPHIVACHGKDVRISDKLTVHIDECIPGEGVLDYGEFLQQLSRLGRQVPLMLEHMKTEVEYARAAQHVRQVASVAGIPIH